MGGSSEPPSEVIKMEVQHGSDRHQIILKGQKNNLTVQDLQTELEKVTAVPVKDQRLFFKSQELHLQPFKKLKDCELENNHVLKLVGEPSKLRYSNYFGRMMPVVPANQNNNQMPMPNSQSMPIGIGQYLMHDQQQQQPMGQYPYPQNSQQGFYQQPMGQQQPMQMGYQSYRQN